MTLRNLLGFWFFLTIVPTVTVAQLQNTLRTVPVSYQGVGATASADAIQGPSMQHQVEP